MAARALVRSVGRSTRIHTSLRNRETVSSRSRSLHACANATKQQGAVHHFVGQRRWYSAATEEPWPLWQFKQMQELSQQDGKSDTIIIDVREPHEYMEGHIPKALNMPINSAPGGLFLSSEDFEERFGFEKPGSDTPVVFYCKAGIRSKGASIIASDAGLTNVKEYRPSFDDWVANNGPIERGKPQSS